ncbi:Type 3 secretion system secretin [Ralstonia mannitolilytica]|uniref:type II and III secretion system protein family protein n=1 Tax=Ralstonia mannitolilytica TaxID=105219 RepID=UPI0007B00002|nr:type II and III secretion system protein family protein [Ralstonia mannitolilytica]ANA34086.1 secretin [Ralstonia mannitolilytica]CAJ0681232.1 Type 3 secretion system secretin [Ralstonia mannitolilytica]CAJ0879695.1 Type 3 secretion system secretin [Ralstonia mannitolilytica]
MKTNQKTNTLRSVRILDGARGFVLAGAAGAVLCMPPHVHAQTAAEAGAVARSTTGPVAVQTRTGATAPVQMTISMNPAMAAPPQADVRGPNCTGAVRSESSVVVPVGKSSIISLPEPVRNRTLGNPGVVQATMVSPQSMYLLGRSVGTTNMIVQGRSGACSIVNVVVNADAGGLQTSLAQLMPGESKIRVMTAADSLVLAGNVSSAQAAQQAMEIARAYAAAAQGGSDKGSAGAGLGGVAGGGGNSGGNVINMMIVDTPQQVMLEVKVAEVSKTLLNQLGSALNLQGGFGSWSGGLLTSLLTGSSTGFFASKANRRPFQVEVDAQKNDSLVKILAEPNLVTLSGQEASFLAGGKIYIPVAQSSSSGGAPTITLQEEEFGVGLKFTPTVMANGRINLKVAPEVSELSPTGATVSGGTTNGQSILPLITTRRASTTVQMRDGESFAIGGLLQDNARGTLKALPGVGEVPVLGTLFRSTQFQHDMTELVIVITPRLVQPMPTASYPLPTDSFSSPNELELYLMGNMEGKGGKNRAAKPAAGSAAPANAPAPSAPSAPRSEVPAPAPAAPAPVAPAAPAPRAQVSTVPVEPPASPAAEPVSAAGASPAATSAPTPADDTAARVARIEATAARLAQARAKTQGRQTAAADTATAQQTR